MAYDIYLIVSVKGQVNLGSNANVFRGQIHLQLPVQSLHFIT